MNVFSVTYARFDAMSAEMADASRSGIVCDGVTLRDALRSINNAMPAASAIRAAYASDSEPRHARWFSVDCEEWETGDSVEYAIHWPENVSAASRARLCRFLEAI